MEPKKTAVVKIARPKLSGIFARERLFRLLDDGRNKPVTWVSAPAGSGKTTLVASWLDARQLPCLWYQIDAGDGDIASFFFYMGQAAGKAAPRYKKSLPLLTPEYLQGIPVFTRRYFEELFKRLASSHSGGFILVFDNYQNAPPESGFHEMMLHALEAVPDGINVVIVSRTDPPPQFARLLANNRIYRLGWDEIRFQREECSDLLRLDGHGTAAEPMVELLYQKTQGWAAGMVLLRARVRSEGTELRDLDRLTMQEIFDYFANEIFNKTDAVIKEFLLKTAFLEKVPPEVAEKLTGIGSTAQILDQLHRDHFFTQKYEQAYQYHPLFQEFLRSRARERFTQQDLSSLQRSAAMLLEQSGRMEQAIKLFIASADWDQALRLILEQAPVLMSQGRIRTLGECLRNLPVEIAGDNPWAVYWAGVCRMYRDPYEGRNYLKRAFDLFKETGERKGLFLAWIRIGETIFFGWGESREPWIRELEAILAQDPSYPAPEIEVHVTLHMFIGGMSGIISSSLFDHWEKKVSAIVFNAPSLAVRIQLGHILMIYHLWLGDFAKAELIMRSLKQPDDKEEESPLVHLTWYAMQAMYAWWIADQEACLAAVTRGLDLADSTGVHFMDAYLFKYGVSCSVSLGFHDRAVEVLRRMSARPRVNLMDKSFYHYLSSLIAWHEGNTRRAVEDGAVALGMVGPLEQRVPKYCCNILQTIACYDDGQFEAARRHLDRTWEIARGGNFAEYVTGLFSARFAFEQGREAEGVALLRAAMAIGAKQGYVNFGYWRSEMMSRLCAKALDYGIETKYVEMLIRRRKLFPENPVDTWPYPIRVYALGTFRIEKDGRPLVFPGKVQKKPLELLKALIAFGSVDVPEERISEALWPNADGDLAHKSLENNIARLRRLLGEERVIVLREGRLSIDHRYCWTDVRAFENAMESAEFKAGAQSPASLSALEKAAALYRGDFLHGEDGLLWAVSRKEELNLKCFKVLNLLASHYERSGEFEKAIECCSKAIAIDALAEEFYLNLMLCYEKLGREADAVRVYHRCVKALSAGLGVEPSSATKALYKRLIAPGK